MELLAELMQQLEQVLELDNSFEVAYSMVAELFVDNYTLELVGNCIEALLVEHMLLVVDLLRLELQLMDY